MEKAKTKTWNEVWQDNYNGLSDVAKDIAKFQKSTYKKDTYIPWAVMLRGLYTLDPYASVEKVMNDNGGFLFTDRILITTRQLDSSQSGDKNDVKLKETETYAYSHMVKVKVHFMGIEFEEVYPVQDNDYSPSKVYDQNKVNKALQRAVTRCISIATGLAYRLYENGDLDFEDDGKVTPPTVETTPTTKKAKTVVVKEEVKIEEPSEPSDDLTELFKFLSENRDNAKVLGLVDRFNQVLPTKYVFEETPLTIDLTTDTDDILLAKLAVIDNPSKMLTGLRKVV
jgi:hypothetical protein